MMPISIPSPVLEHEPQRTPLFVWYGLTRADLADIWQLFQSVNRAEDGDHNETLQDLERKFDDAWLEPLKDARVIRAASSKLAALVRVFVNPKPENENVAQIECEIAPDARGQGLEEEILDWAEQNAVERLAHAATLARDENTRTVIRVNAPANRKQTIAFYNAHGFHTARAFYKMQRDLDTTIPDAPLSDGLTLRGYDTSLDEELRQAFNEAFGDNWGFQSVPPQEWQPFVMGVASVRRDLSLLVMDGDEVAAFCINCERVAENERLGIRRGWTTKLGTRRAWRKRGLATFLLAESMRRFRAEGFEYAGLGVDAENDTGALGLYERLGYRAYKTRYVLEKQIG